MYSAVAQRLAQLMLLKVGPQDLPASKGLLQFAVGFFLLFAVLRMLLVVDLGTALAQSVLSLLVLSAYLRSVLIWRKAPERMGQTLTALLLTGGCIGALLLFPLRTLQPLLAAIAENPEISPQQLQVPALAMYAWLGVSLWGLVISGHIFRHALNMNLSMGIGITLIFEFLWIGIVGTLGSLF
jgi:hypothetical protein